MSGLRPFQLAVPVVFSDPSGNALEFKAFADDGQIFAKEVAV
jgi:extradiol dioxygenase family protein